MEELKKKIKELYNDGRISISAEKATVSVIDSFLLKDWYQRFMDKKITLDDYLGSLHESDLKFVYKQQLNS